MRKCSATWVRGAMMLAALLSTPANATWSIVALDPETGQVGGAAATCTPWAWAIFSVVPGKGVIVTQANSNRTARYRGEMLLRLGESPTAIVAAITDPDFDPTRAIQQHGVVAFGFEPDAAGFTGTETGTSHGDLQARGVSVQGNILTGISVLTETLAAFQGSAGNPSLTLADRLLLALEAGSAAGGDRRCGTQTAQSAHLIVMRPEDHVSSPLYYMTEAVDRGGRNAVRLLRERYDRLP